MEPVPTGLIGFGGRGTNAARAIAEASTLEFVAVSDLREERVEKAKAEFDVEGYTDAAAMLARDDIEAAVVITRVAGHAPLSIQALEAGKHVLCTKPMAETVAEAQEMVEAARRTGLKGAVEFQNRYTNPYWTMNEVAAELDPVQVTVTHQRGLFNERYLKPGYAYGILDGAIHRIDIANWLVGLTPRSVSGTVRYKTFTPKETIDTVNIQVEYTDGRTAELISSMAGEGLDDICQVVGKAGNAQPDGGDIAVNEVQYNEDAGEQKERQQVTAGRRPLADPPTGTATEGLYEDFGRYVHGDPAAANVPTFQDGLESLLVAKAAVESSERGERVHLADLRTEGSSV